MTASGGAFRQMRAIAREPLVHFFIIGLAAWLAVTGWRARDLRYTIEIGDLERRRISEEYVRQFGIPPPAQQWQRLLDHHIREEIYRREALALGLDLDDEIVRRRLVQKFEFLQTDLAMPDVPTDAQLVDWFAHQQQRYRLPARVSLAHVYFSPDREGEDAARQRAERALSALRSSNGPSGASLGDAFPGPTEVAELALPEARKLFGDSELTRRLFELTPGQWSGPWRSGYGWHLVRVTAHISEEARRLDQVRATALDDYLAERRRLANEAQFLALRSRYTVRFTGAER
jgi:hypothetical protein